MYELCLARRPRETAVTRVRDSYTRHVRFYMGLWPLVVPALCRWFRLERTMLSTTVQTPFLLVSNHNTDLDPALVGACYRGHMYFVASEHALRGGLGGWLLKKLFAPIARQKGGTDALSAMQIIRKLRGGANVALFAEGNRSFDGVTGPMFPATGKMVKAARCALVTFKLEGGYFTSPRWSKSMRRGRMKAYPVRVYAREQIEGMSASEINDAIANDLYEDAYARQARENTAFQGKNLAEHLETALFICPQCGGVGTLKSEGNRFLCTCGLSAAYDEYGRISGAPFATVPAWDAWQKERLPLLIHDDAPFFEDASVTLREIAADGVKTVARGAISMRAASLAVNDAVMPLAEIADMALVGRGAIVLTWNGKHYELRGAKDFCGRKYLLMFQHLKARQD